MSRVGGAPRGLCCVARVGVAACRRPGPRREVHVAWRVSELRHVAGRGRAARFMLRGACRSCGMSQAGGAPRGLWGVARVEVAACRRSGARREVHVAWRVSELRHVAGRGRAARFMLRGACRSCGMSRVGAAPRERIPRVRAAEFPVSEPGPRHALHPKAATPSPGRPHLRPKAAISPPSPLNLPKKQRPPRIPGPGR